MFRPLPVLLCDFYKISHRIQYPEGTEYVYSNFTPRSGKHFKGNSDRVVVFGIYYVIKKISEIFKRDFFNRPIEDILKEYCHVIKYSLNEENPDTKHIEELHELGYLPLLIKGLPEGISVPYQTPILTIVNTDPRFYWLTNFLETLISCELWHMCTNATLALDYRILMEKYADRTCDSRDHVLYQCHDFSMRGLSSLDSAITSGMAHLTSFLGTDSIPAIQGMEYYYHADNSKNLVGCSIPASEHSVMSAGGMNELEVFDRFITELYPNGFVSIVSDTYDFFGVLQNVLPKLKNKIMARDGKVVIRPDSGNPADIVCGKRIVKDTLLVDEKGAIDYLWETFGGTINSKGFKVLDSHIGLIYGDSITLEVALDILQRLEAKGFASSNIVFGVGSFTYQFNSRDSQGWAVKATYCVINGNPVDIFKKPKTDSTKNSKKGLLRVELIDGEYIIYDQQSKGEEKLGELKVYFDNGFIMPQHLDFIRANINNNIRKVNNV